MDYPIKDNPDSHYDEVQRWAQRRQKQLDLAKQKGGLGIWDKIMHGPKNLMSTWNLNTALKDQGGTQALGEYDMNAMTNVYDRLLEAASQGTQPSVQDRIEWMKYKKQGHL